MKRLLLNAFGVLLCLAMVGLGGWQLDRAGQKETLLGGFERALQQPPVSLVRALRRTDSHPVRAAGPLSFPESLPWLVLDNQHHDGRVGVRVYRLAERSADLPLLAVEFGWLAMPADRELPQLGSSPQPQQASGILLSPPASGLRLGSNAPLMSAVGPVRLLTYLDPAELAAQLGRSLHPLVFRLDPDLPIGFARDLQVLPNTLPPVRHRGYAMQWFGLAAALLIIIVVMNFRRATL